MVLKIIGWLLVTFGVVDVVGGFTGLDVWTDWIGVELPAVIWSFTAYIEMGLGYFLIKLGSRTGEIEPTEDVPSEGQIVENEEVGSDSAE